MTRYKVDNVLVESDGKRLRLSTSIGVCKSCLGQVESSITALFSSSRVRLDARPNKYIIVTVIGKPVVWKRGKARDILEDAIRDCPPEHRAT